MFQIQRRRQEVARQTIKQERPDDKPDQSREYCERKPQTEIKTEATKCSYYPITCIKKELKHELLMKSESKYTIKSEPEEYTEDMPVKMEKVDLTHLEEEYSGKTRGNRLKFSNKKLKFKMIPYTLRYDKHTKKNVPSIATVNETLKIPQDEIHSNLPRGIVMEIPPNPIPKSGLRKLLEKPLEGFDSYTLNMRMFK